MYLDGVKEHFMMALDVRNPGAMIGSIVGTTVALSVIGGLLTFAKRTTESVLTGDLSGIPAAAVAGIKDVVTNELEILEVLKPSKGNKALKASRYNSGKRRGSR